MEDDLEHWEWIRDQRTEDLALEMKRDEDPYLIELLKQRKKQALKEIEELTNE
jgi:hypothetical protein